ncbi:isoleucyl-tRNA synthetase [Eremomyces bilateralis CBS 781.70]|uniref:isoleucine--tRNA ligase n=1 Tax=Eremomyces bilateralis CBS 781.70 TaxID=1392243 RepID=A0A6G1FXT8_9PEZI|nr:isoleucyl-tRNA synthetase [Eremomyces bilateralis CBS 781.70]KAF1810500.1 isoleucyl-tRNA synthetase [Eremomyces bilateralis CBS 781.70]
MRISSPFRAQWTATLKLPKSTLPARPPLPSPYLARCTDEFYSWQGAQVDRPSFTLHDGPPYANGGLHAGHAVNKILKDIICRFQVGEGKRVQYVPGWDCHGLPIELKAIQAQKSGLDPPQIRNAARRFALDTIEEQKRGFKEWAVMGDWGNAYKTLDAEFELNQLQVFKNMVRNRLIYRAKKPVYWSGSSRTALAEAELEYDDNFKSTAAFIGYPIVSLPTTISQMPGVDPARLRALVWTTTPWTLPANKAIAVNNILDYYVVEPRISSELSSGLPQYLVCTTRVEFLQTILNSESVSIIAGPISGKEIAGQVEYLNPLQRNQRQKVVHADFVTSSSGSGLVHMAPGHGVDDYNMCADLGLEPFAPVDDYARFTSEALPASPETLAGKPVQTEGTVAILDYLRAEQNGDPSRSLSVLATHEITHKYPIDWRTKQPLIIRATEQWFADVAEIKPHAIQALTNVKFLPESSRARLESFVNGRSHWCISRQRSWGVPIPALYRTDKGDRQPIMTEGTIEHILDTMRQRGVDCWWTDAEDDQAWIPPNLSGSYERGKDTMDVWFDSGTSWMTLAKDTSTPVADVYLEGSDQHRGWFQSSLLTFVSEQLLRNDASSSPSQTAPVVAPFKTLITHGFTLDEHGIKMSKSIGNVVAPSQIMDGSLLPPLKKKGKGSHGAKGQVYDALGPDVLRLWVAGSDYTKDIVLGETLLKLVSGNLHKARVTLKWLLGVLNHYQPSEWKGRDVAQFRWMDQMAMVQLEGTYQDIVAHYRSYEFHRGIQRLNHYINTDLSAFYFEALKDRLYTGGGEDRMAAQFVCFQIFQALLKILSPITPLLVEETYAHAPVHLQPQLQHPLQRLWEPSSLMLSLGKESVEGLVATQSLDEQFALLKTLSSAVKTAQEAARSKGLIGSGLETSVVVHLSESAADIWQSLSDIENAGGGETRFGDGFADELAAVLVVSEVQVIKGDRPMENITAWEFEEKFEFAGCQGRVSVHPSPRAKCPRCWRHVANSQEDLCVRCEDVVKSC